MNQYHYRYIARTGNDGPNITVSLSNRNRQCDGPVDITIHAS